MNDIISPEELAAALTECCAAYSDEIREKVEDGVQQIGMEAVEEVRSLSPVYTGKSKKLKKGAYKRGWRYEIKRSRGTYRVTVHNALYQLTHLLENQHLNRDGTTYSKAIPHISIANENAQKKVDKLLEDL